MGAYVDYDVVDCTLRAADQLCFGARRCLVMHAPQCASPRIERSVALNEVGAESFIGELIMAKRTCEESALIEVRFDFDEVCSFKSSRQKFHGLSSLKPSVVIVIGVGLTQSRTSLVSYRMLV